MADIDIINVGGTDYNIKDSTARSTASAAQTAANGKAPISHAVNASTYGLATGSAFGHVKLADAFDTRIGATADAIGASQVAVYNLYNKAYGNIQYQALSTYGNGATKVIARNTTYVKTSPSQFMAFKCGRIGLVNLGFTWLTAVGADQEIDIVTNIEFLVAAPLSLSLNFEGKSVAAAWSHLNGYNKGKIYTGTLYNAANNTSSVRIYTGPTGIEAGTTMYGSFWCITA